MKHKLLFAAVAAISIMTSCKKTAAETYPQLGKDPIDSVIAAMTVEEKVRLIVGIGMDGANGDQAVVGQVMGKVPGAAGATAPIPRLGIPSIVLADGPAGLRINPTREGDDATYYCTHFPIATLLASTWDTELVEHVGEAIGNEVLEYGADVLLAPALNIHRNPLNGRNFEYYSEDPLVAGKMAAAYVRGVQSNGVGTSIKHYAANSQESNRTGNDAQMSQRALREIYLKGFEIAVKESDPWTVMTSYNKINGVYTSESPELVDTILRQEWGFGNAVMTDWFGGRDAVAQMLAQNDMLQPGTPDQITALVEAVKSGKLDEAVLDRNVKNILELILKTPSFKGYQYSNKPDLQAHAAITRQSASDGMVLLKNDGKTLPLKADQKQVALFGCTSYDFIAGGTGSGNVNRAYTVSLLDGLKNAGYTYDTNLEKKYTAHIEAEAVRNAPDPNDGMAWLLPPKRPAEIVPTAAELSQAAAANDVAMITLGRTSGEFLDRLPSDFNLSADEQALIDGVTQAFHAAGKPVVVVLNVGGVIETDSWNDKPDAILLAWQAGQEGGNSVADIISGKVTPSGKLPMTFPIAFADHASSANFPTQARDIVFPEARDTGEAEYLWDYTPYLEDIYVGYRFFDTFGKGVSYPFGYGLSYTEFAYTDAAVKDDADNLHVFVTITNVGEMPGREVAQVYVKQPNSQANDRPIHELKGFAKTQLLQPGESQELEIIIPKDDLALFDEQTSSWIHPTGVYEIQIGASAHDLRAGRSYTLTDGKKRQVHNVMAPKEKLKTLHR